MVGEYWTSSKARAVFLDYGGTLVDQDSYRGIERQNAFQGKGSFRSPPETIRKALSTICCCNNSWVFIVSGRSREEMEQSMKGIRRLGLASEEGFFYRFPGR